MGDAAAHAAKPKKFRRVNLRTMSVRSSSERDTMLSVFKNAQTG